MEKQKTKRKAWKILLIVFLSVILFAGSVLGVLGLGVAYTAKHWEYFRPDYEKIDISPLLYKSERTDEEYRTLYEQTGLTKLGIDGLLQQNNARQILRIQEAFFGEYEVTADHFAIFTYIEEIDAHIPLAALKEGDILVSATTRVSWFRYGHAALVVDGANGEIAESVSPGTLSRIVGANTFDYLANFMVLRPNLDEKLKEQVAAYAKENLIGIPYKMTAGLFSKAVKEEPPKGLQCAYLVWYAYKKFGIDLDSNGGLIIKPQDLALSPCMEVVQNFGFDLDGLWSE